MRKEEIELKIQSLLSFLYAYSVGVEFDLISLSFLDKAKNQTTK